MNDMARWSGKVALVTGASAGIGTAAAEALARNGVKTAITARSGERLEALKTRLEGGGGQVMAIPADLQIESEIHKIFDAVREEWGGLDILINNAGLGYIGTLADQQTSDWRGMLDVNVFALSVCTQEALKDMRGKAEGHIVNISSLAGHRVPPGTNNAYYSATKHAVKAITDAVRMELVAGNSHIRVGMISPGMVETEFHDRATKGEGDSHAFYGRFRPLDASDVADAMCYMLAAPRHVAIHDIVMRSVAQPH